MERISSKSTFFYKRIFPVIWFGMLIVFAAVALFGPGGQEAFPPIVLVMLAVMGLVGFFVMKKMVFDLVDDVVDEGHVLVVRKGREEDRIALADIINVNYSPLINPPRVTLSLRKPSVFGKEVTFCAPVSFVPLRRSAVIDGLIERIDTARRSHR